MSENLLEKDVKEQKRIRPASNIDLQLMTTNSVWGEPSINKAVKDKLKISGGKIFYKKGDVIQTPTGFLKFEEDTTIELEADYWSILDVFTRDLRLGNISRKDGEMEYCQYMLDLATDLLQDDFKAGFTAAIRRLASVIELSQSKGGFLRNKFNTLTYEQYTEEREPPKKGLFGTKKNKQG
jgi:hypothetical protein